MNIDPVWIRNLQGWDQHRYWVCRQLPAPILQDYAARQSAETRLHLFALIDRNSDGRPCEA